MRLFLISALLVIAAGCQTGAPKDPTTIDLMKQSLAEASADAGTRRTAPPPEVAASLMPAMNIQLGGGRSTAKDRRFDVNVNGLAARDFFMSLVDGTDFNMVVHPDVGGDISLVLKNVTIPEVMTVMRDVYGYEFNQAASGFQVLPVRMQTRIFQVNYLNMKRSGNTEMRVSAGQVSSAGSSNDSGTLSGSSSSTESVPASKVVSESDANFWGELRTALETLIPTEGGRSIVVSPQTGVVVVRAMPNELREIENFLRTTQSTLQRQVILEAKIMEVILKDGFQSGINWSKVASLGGGRTLTLGQAGGPLSSGDVDSGVSGGIFSIALETGSFSGLIELLETQGNVQILSSPRVSTVNNQKAVIKVGQDEYFITDISTTATTGDNPLISPDVTLTPFFSGIALDVTPQIDSRGGVTLHVHPSISDVQDQEKRFRLSNGSGETTEQSVPTALSTVRESDSIVYAVSGQIVVIGGLMQETAGEDIAAPPVLGDIPFFGAAFRQAKQVSRKSELVILLKPLVVDSPGDWSEPVAQSANAIDRLDRGFHYGGRSEVFGSKAEGR